MNGLDPINRTLLFIIAIGGVMFVIGRITWLRQKAQGYQMNSSWGDTFTHFGAGLVITFALFWILLNVILS